jgi:hypothetical protein
MQACLSGDRKSLKKLWHKDALILQRKSIPEFDSVKARTVGSLSIPYINGNEKIAFAWGLAGIKYDPADPRRTPTIGTQAVLSVWRKQADKWRLMIVTDDPISVIQIERIAKQIDRLSNTPASRAPRVKLLAPENGLAPVRKDGESFGTFKWQFSSKPFLEFAEFDYAHGTRFIANPNGKLSAGELWNVREPWLWRVWSIAQDGDVSLSEVRTFRD